jgi:fructose-1,6-bisphosphatase II
MVLRGKTGTVRRIQSWHKWNKLMQFSAIKYD